MAATRRMLNLPDGWQMVSSQPAVAEQSSLGLDPGSAHVTQLEARIAAGEVELANLRARLAGLQEEEAERTARVCHEAAERGHAEGRLRAEQEAQVAVHKELTHIQVLLHELRKQQSLRAEECEDVLVEITFAAVCRVLGDQAAHPEGLRALVRQAADDLADRDVLQVRLHPDDVELVAGMADSVPAGVTLLADSAIRLGGCLIDGSGGTLDARLETQIAELAAALSAARAVRRARGEAS
jgi:flagellar biosynthesis/type III secretory pathway protein FliH